MTPSPALMGQASAAAPVTSTMQDPMQGAASGDLSAFAGQMRDITSKVDELAAANPDIATDLEPIKGILRQAMVKKASTASMQTPSALALPSGGM